MSRGPAGVTPPKQSRSQETFTRILDATDRLLRERRFDEVSTVDICNEAGVSASSLYARFASKDAVLLALIDRQGERLRDSIRHVGDQLAVQHPVDLPALVRALVSEAVYFAHSYDHLEMAARPYTEARERLVEVQEVATDWVLERAGELLPDASPSLRRRLDFAVRAAASVTQRGVGGYVRFTERTGMSDDELIDEVTRLTLAYVEAALALEAGSAG